MGASDLGVERSTDVRRPFVTTILSEHLRGRWGQIQRRTRASESTRAAMRSIVPTTTQKSQACSKRPTLKFMPMMPPSTVAGRRMTVTSVSTFMMLFVRCPMRATRRSNDPNVDSFVSRAASNAPNDTAFEIGEELSGLLRGERVELGMCQRDNHLAVRGERSTKRPDPAADLDQPVQLVRNISARGLRHDLRVKLFQLTLDLLEGAEVDGDDPLANCCNERGSVESTDLPAAFGALEELLEYFNLLAMGGDDPIRTEEAVDGNERGRIFVACDSDQRHIQALSIIRHRRAFRRIPQTAREVVPEPQRIHERVLLILRRVAQSQPQELSTAESFEGGAPIHDSFGLLRIE